ncbi:major facilitator superfamily domain-containing protein [Panaeolus papilionaceus]|nr:major facilitator superfamily domain-containing protein [Panaeolus papilionaceus]
MMNTSGTQSVDQVTVVDKHVVPNSLATPTKEKPNEGVDPVLLDAELKIVDVDKEQEEEPEYPAPLKLALILASLYLSVFLVGLDQTILITAIPKITAQFDSIDDVGWYGSAYLLTLASFQLLFGRLYNMSVKRVFLCTVALFEVGSLICGIAPNSTTLIVGRAVAGLGSAGIFSGALIIIAHAVPLEKRPIYTTFIASIWGISAIIGPLLGGAFTDKLTWRWCFYINLPIGGLSILFIATFFHEPKLKKTETIGFFKRLMTFDPIGCLLFVPAIICLLLALQWGGSKFPWSDGRVIALFVLFAVLIIAFAFVQRWMGNLATIPPYIIQTRDVWASVLYAGPNICAFFTLLFYLPIWFQAIKGDTAVESGIRLLPFIVACTAGSIASGAMVQRTGYYNPFLIAGTILTTTGSGLLTTLEPTSSSSRHIGYQFIAGFGMGIACQVPAIAVQNVLPMSDIPIGIVIVTFAQSVGGALGVSIGNSLFVNRLVQGLRSFTPSLDPQFVLSLGPTNLGASISADVLPGVIKAYNSAVTTAFFVSVVASCITVIGALVTQWKRLSVVPELAVA